MFARTIAIIGVLTWLLVLPGCAHTPVSGEGRPAPSVIIQEGKLQNGLKILVLEDHSAPVVTVQVWYRVGSRNERPGIRGLAHLLEHMMFKGSENVGPEMHAQIIDAIGGQENAFTAEDVTSYFDTVPADRLDLAMELESERMAKAKLDETHFFKEREVVKEEVRLRQQNNPMGALLQKFRSVAFSKHPYSWSVGGTLEDLDQITLDDLKSFYKTYYAPNNAVLIVVGDTSMAKATQIAQKYFGPVPAQPSPPAMTLVEPAQDAYRREELFFPTQLPVIIGGYKTPEAANHDSPVLEVIQRILGEGQSSRLVQALVRQQKLSVFASAWNDQKYDPGLFLIVAGFTPDKKPQQVEEALISEIERLGSEGPGPEELAKAKKQLAAEYIFKLESMQNLGVEIGMAEVIGRDYHRFMEGARPYDRVTADDIKRVVKTYLTRSRLTVATLMPPKPGEQVKKDAATRIEKAELPTTSWATAERFLKPGFPSSAPIPLPPISRQKLPNGLNILIVERHEQPIVYFDLVVPGGVSLEPKGKAGLAGLMAEMLTQGTSRRSADQVAIEVDSLGGQLSASSDSESTQLSGHFLAQDLQKGLDLFADVALSPIFPAEELEKLRPQMEGQVRMSKDRPTSLAFEHLRYLIFGYDHPRGRPASLETVGAVKTKDLSDMYRLAFQPQVALLCICGDVDPQKTIQMLQKHFAGWQKVSDISPSMPETTLSAKRLIRLVDKPDLTQATVAVGQIGVSKLDPDYTALVLGNYTLGGGGFSSRLMQSVRVKGGKSYGVGSSFSAGRARGPFWAYTFTRNSETANTLKLVLDEIEKMRQSGVTADELLSAKNHLAGNYPLLLQTPDGMASEILMAEFYGLGEDWVRSYRQRITTPALEEVNTAIGKHLDVSKLAVVVVSKAAEVLDQIKSFGETVTVDYLAPVPDEERQSKTPSIPPPNSK